MDGQERVLPLFLKRMNIPGDEHVSCYDMCRAAEKVSGDDTMTGAQDIRGLWRLYPRTSEARQTLLMQGIELRGVRLELLSENPYSIRTIVHRNGVRYGYERPTTRLWISDLPISVADSEIELSLSKINVELRSVIKRERARNKEGKMTHYETGRRYVFISIPTDPLEKDLKIAIFKATLYHKEMKQVRKRYCYNCLQEGHLKGDCENEVVCVTCKTPGHKKNDPQCPGSGDWSTDDEIENINEEEVTFGDVGAVGGAAVSTSVTSTEPTLATSLPTLSAPSTSTSPSHMAPPKPPRGRSPTRASKRGMRSAQVPVKNAFEVLTQYSRSRSTSTKRKQDESTEDPPNKTLKPNDEVADVAEVAEDKDASTEEPSNVTDT